LERVQILKGQRAGAKRQSGVVYDERQRHDDEVPAAAFWSESRAESEVS
jgi:hypothetical protein